MKAAGLVVKESVYYRDPMLSSDITVGTQDSHSRVQGHRYPIYLAETTLKPTLGSACPLNMIRADTLSQWRCQRQVKRDAEALYELQRREQKVQQPVAEVHGVRKDGAVPPVHQAES
jgi:hypothetical protein